MSLRMRKSINVGKLGRVTLSKSGVGVSVGVPGFRVGVGSDGKVRRTVGIPGTGIYDTEVIGSVNPAKGKGQAVKPRCPECGKVVGARDRFCKSCGTKLV